MTLSSLEPGSAVGEKGKKRGQIGKISVSEARQTVSNTDFATFFHNGEPGPKLDIKYTVHCLTY